MGPPPPSNTVRDAVAVPAILLIITGVIGVLMVPLGLLFREALEALVRQLAEQSPDLAPAVEAFEKPRGFANTLGSLIPLVTSVLTIVGAWQLKNLRSYGLAMAAAIVALVPCFGPCCCIGLPVGIWTIAVLLRPDVRTAFR